VITAYTVGVALCQASDKPIAAVLCSAWLEQYAVHDTGRSCTQLTGATDCAHAGMLILPSIITISH